MPLTPSPAVVGMVTSYPGLTQSDWLWKQSPHAFGLWGQIQLKAQDPAPHWLLLYQFDWPAGDATSQGGGRVDRWLGKIPGSLGRRLGGGGRSPQSWDPERVFRGVPPERRIFLLREPPLAELAPQRPRTYQLAADHCGYVSGPDDFAPHPDYMPAIWYHANRFQDLDQAPPPAKVRGCSWITSGIDRTANHRQRLDFLRSLQGAKGAGECPVDFYGRRLPSWVQSQGEVANKWFAMAPYYYNLAIENYRDNNWYVSEKLWDALLAWCLPIYYGGPAADRLIPPESFLRLPSLDAQGIAYIQEVIQSPNLWKERLDAIAEARQIILHRLNLLNWLSEFVGGRS